MRKKNSHNMRHNSTKWIYVGFPCDDFRLLAKNVDSRG